MQVRSRRIGTGIAWLWALAAPLAAATDETESMRVARRLAEAIRFETVSHEAPLDFEAAPFLALMSHLRETYPRTHETLRLETANDYTLLYEWPGNDENLAPALFMAHTDVVPVEGAALEQGFEPERTLCLAFGHDEEIGGNRGAKVVAARLAERGVRLAFLFDEGGFLFDDHPLVPDVVVAQINTAEKAYLTIRLRARGVSGHSSMPPRTTAIGRLARAIHRMEEHPMPARITPPMRQMFEAAAPHLPWTSRFAFRNLWLAGGAVKRRLDRNPLTRAQLRTTFAATLIEGGIKDNVIPESAEATVNVRLLPGDSEQDVVAHLRRVIDDEGIEIEAEFWGQPAAPASPEGPGFRLATDAVHAVLPEAVVLPGLIPGATDSRHFTGISDEILRFVPARFPIGLASGAHGRDERLPIASLDDSVAIAVGMMRRAGAPEAVAAVAAVE